ncbi:hypothetical protein FGO68_gene12864 [Halteria grandinella]|uniref:Uncharacterized protein n=1 Tax=Halteria grandinella TaxID=5974 RepID=A0A8J8NLP6_HALGN|nr:hypothetical protein FGO68_gene12864 [Halteria grandinella]
MINDASVPRPPLNKAMPRLYGHFLCPYAERVRLALSARNVKFERCEINLKDKPQWHQEIEGGTIPLLELPAGEILKDSKVLMEYVEETYKNQGYSTLPPDAKLRAKLRMSIPLAESLFSAWIAVLSLRTYSEPEMKIFNAKLKEIESFLKDNSITAQFFLGTANPTQLDIHMYACLSRPYFTKNSVFHDELFKHMHFEECERIVKFIKAMQARPEFQAVLSKEITHHEYLKEVKTTAPGTKVALYLPIAH